MQTQEGILSVVVAPGRSVKRGGRIYESGAPLEMTRAEFDAHPGLYVIPGSVADPAQVAKQEKQARDDADRADKLRRMAEEQKRREENAARVAQQLEEQAKLAKAGSARLQRQRRVE